MWDDIRPGLVRWREDRTRFALATVVRASGSAPRQAGAAMAVSEGGSVLGSISGGCVEADVYEHAAGVLATGEARLVRYGVTDAEAFAVGLTCGGTLEVFIEPVDEISFPGFDELLASLEARKPVVLGTRLAPGVLARRHVAVGVGSGGPRRDAAAEQVGQLLGTSGVHLVEGCDRPDEAPMFLQASADEPRMIIFGAVDFAAALSSVGRFLGYRVTVCDARPVFTTAHRFPDAHEVVVDRPHRYLADQTISTSTVLCVLTHDPKYDVPLLEVALATDAGFIGVMGSRRAHDDRVRRLREIGVRDDALDRLRSPVGLDLGGRTPQETAISIAAEIIAATTGRSGQPLRDVGGTIHAVPPAGVLRA
ncbi:MAG: XdhC family protein [Marmoricola sp.]